MSLERSKQVQTIFQRAMECPPEERNAFLSEYCGGDADLRMEVEQLFTQASTGGFFPGKPVGEGETLTLDYPHSLLGRRLGPYQIVSRIGVGGMGEVYRAHDGKLGRDVAIKTLPAEFAHNHDRLIRFRREARMLASLNHPNIAAIYGLQDSDDVDCLVMELVEGESPKGPCSVTEALGTAAQIAHALSAAHEKGIVHRDLKPANIKVTQEGRVKVLDFGLAKALGPEQDADLQQLSQGGGDVTMVGNIIGTPAYMSPEQARGERVDQRADIWAFGCILFELLTGKRIFQRRTLRETLEAVLEREPEWHELPARTPAPVRSLLRHCLRKDPERRLSDIGGAIRVIEAVQRGKSRFAVAAALTLLILAGAAGSVVLLRRPARPADPSQWTQLTKFADSVSQPALSPDGRMVTFIRGPATFVGPGQVYVKMLPNGESVELTHDNTQKLHPQFSFDGTRITYGTYSDREFAWDTWEVPVPGGEATRVFRNATGLTWIGPAQVLFSEIKMGVHMGVVTADENRTKSRDVYLPSSEPRMAHRSWLSPDRKWVLLDEMDDDHLWEPCRVVPFDGSGSGHKVGPSEGGCTAGAWSPDGKWMYVTSSAVDGNHIWRQRFPEGKPEQLTFGPTEEEGIAMSPDGHSFITAVALANTSLWRHDTNGEHEIPIEGNPAEVRLTPDGRKVLYRLVREPPSEFSYSRDAGELRIIDLQTGRWEPVVRNMQVVDYDISSDGQQVVIQAANSQLWLMPLDRGGPPRRIPNATGGFPRFLPDGEILFRRTGGGIAAGTSGFIYRIRPDGTGIRKALDVPVLVPVNVSPDGEWFQAWAPVGNGGPPAIQLFPLEGGNPVLVATATMFTWSPDGRYVSIASDDGILVPEGRSYVVPLPAGRTLPPIPAGGFTSEEQIASLRGARKIDIAGADVSVSGGVIPGSSPDSYVFYRGRVQRNLYRIPIY